MEKKPCENRLNSVSHSLNRFITMWVKLFIWLKMIQLLIKQANTTRIINTLNGWLLAYCVVSKWQCNSEVFRNWTSCTRIHMTKKAQKCFHGKCYWFVMKFCLPLLLMCTCLIILVHAPARNHTTFNQNDTRRNDKIDWTRNEIELARNELWACLHYLP